MSDYTRECYCPSCTLQAQHKLLKLHNAKLESFVAIATGYSVGSGQLCSLCHRNHVATGNRYCWQCQDYGQLLGCDLCGETCFKDLGSVPFEHSFRLAAISSYDSSWTYCESCMESADVEYGICENCNEHQFVETEDREFCDSYGQYHTVPDMLSPWAIIAMEENSDGSVATSINGIWCYLCRCNKAKTCYTCNQTLTRDSVSKVMIRGGSYSNHNYCLQCLHTRDDLCWCDDCTVWYASTASCSCYAGTILDYGYRPPSFRYHTSAKRPDKQSVFYGVELESAFCGDNLLKSTKLVLDNWNYLLKDFMYAKYDGTVADGVEFVTHPFTWRHLQENRDDWVKFFDKCNEFKFDGNDVRAGMHIHFSRKQIRGTRLYSILRFIHGNPFLMERIGRRSVGDGSNMERYAPIVETQKGIVDKVTGNWDSDSARKYNAVNLKNRATIELRFFKGVNTYTDFRRNMEFTRALVQFSKISGMNIWPHTFAKYVYSRSKTYPVLTKTLQSILGREI